MCNTLRNLQFYINLLQYLLQAKIQATFAFSNKSDKNNKLLVNNSNYLNNNKLFVNDGNYLHDNKLINNDDNTFDYSGNVEIANNTKILNITSNNNPTFPDFSTMN